MKGLYDRALVLLMDLISIPSFSREEHDTAQRIFDFLTSHNISAERSGNNVWCKNFHFSHSKPTILFNSHHDTVKPNLGYTRDPFVPEIIDGKLYGLGSNDAGGCLVSLLMTFIHFYDHADLPFNIIFSATAEEEISGSGGVESILDQLAPIAFGIVGEPTQMQMAVAEKGLMVLDCTAKGVAGHAARNIGKNAIYEAIRDIEWIRTYRFPLESSYLGPVKMSVTVINAGSQHNVIPDSCQYVVDVRLTDAYSADEVLQVFRENVSATVVPRSTRLRPSGLPLEHILRDAAHALGIPTFGSATTSDQALMDFPTVKMGPGVSERSHTADEFIYLHELEAGINDYIKLLNEVFKLSK